MLSSSRVALQGTTPHLHEQQALEWVKKTLPDAHPFRIWALFDLVDLTGRRYEVDLLVLGYDALYHVELKGHPGRVFGDVVDWVYEFPDRGRSVKENPLRLAGLKSRVLASLLEKELGASRPYVETLVFLSDADVRVDLQGAARTGVVTRGTFLRAVQFGQYPGANPGRRRPIDGPAARAIAEALKAIGIKKSQGAQRVGPYALGDLVEEGPGYQDSLAHNERMPEIRRRVRCYLVPQSPTAERRDQLRRAAEREARILTAIGDHPGILRMTDYEADGPSGGPCILFEHFEEALPLDTFLRQNPELSFEARLAVLEQIADALTYCHRKKVLHRGLAPATVLVRPRPGGKGLEAKIYNFQLASQGDGSQGTVHLSHFGTEPSLVYRAPELVENPAKASVESDVFSLGAIAYFLFTGKHPGATLAERHRLLEAGQGRLSIAAVDDRLAQGTGSAARPDTGERSGLDGVVGYATERNSFDRADDAHGWMQLLLDRVTAPPPASMAAELDPLEARPGQMLGEYEIVKVLGSGSTAKVFRVKRDSAHFALKVSLGAELDARLLAEAEALKKLRGDRIVSHEETRVIAGRACLLLQDAGETLADILAQKGAVSLDYAHRWGEDLLLALRELESRQILHRDIKPANLGVTSGEAKRTRNLFLFDFSLAGLDPRETTVGTPVYRDPFVIARGAWDEAADRFSAAITLHEILTGARPTWGADAVAATATDEPMRVDAERFDPSVREGLHAFFRRAFARRVEDRHESAEAMRTAWLACFFAPASASERDLAEPVPELDVARLSDAASIQAIEGLSARAKSALDRSGVISVRDVLSLPENQLSAIRGVGRDTAREILRLIQGVRAARPQAEVDAPFAAFEGEDLPVADLAELSPAGVVALSCAGLGSAREVAATPRARLERILSRVPDGMAQVARALAGAKAASSGAEPSTVEELVDRVFPPGKRGKYIRELFGIDEAPGGGFASDASDLARRHQIKAPVLHAALVSAREGWSALGPLSELAPLLIDGLVPLGGAASLERLGELLLEACPNQGDTAARRGAAALVRAVGEVQPGLVVGRVGSRVWLARTAAHVSVARLLGQAADALCLRVPLLSFDQARKELAERLSGRDVPALDARETAPAPFLDASPERLVALAAEASERAAVSARLELYPRGMEARRALDLSVGALSAARIAPEQVRRAVAVRYPEALALPADEEALARLLEPLGLTLREGLFERPAAFAVTTQHTELLPPRRTTGAAGPRPTTDPGQQEKRELNERLRVAARNRRFRVLEVAANHAERAASELSRVLETDEISLEREILRELEAILSEREIDWSIVEETDRRGPDGSDDWIMLSRLVEESAERVVSGLVSRRGTLLLTQPGILARYGLSAPLHALLRTEQRDDGPGVFLLVPGFGDPSPTAVIHAPTGSLAVPLTSQASQRLRIPEVWITNG